MTVSTVLLIFAQMELSHYCVEKYRDRTGDERPYWKLMKDWWKGEFYENASDEVKSKLFGRKRG